MSFPRKIKNTFPFIGFLDYYFPILIPKSRNDSSSRMVFPKILILFSNDILQKFDLFYYLKLVRTNELLKNVYLRKKAEKEELQFLLKYLYFVRDSDIDFISKKLD